MSEAIRLADALDTLADDTSMYKPGTYAALCDSAALLRSQDALVKELAGALQKVLDADIASRDAVWAYNKAREDFRDDSDERRFLKQAIIARDAAELEARAALAKVKQ